VVSLTTSTLISSSYKSPVGRLTLVASAQGLRAILWPNDDPRRVPGVTDAKKGTNSVLRAAAEQLDEYFAGTRHEFDLPLDPDGTDFQLSVWQVLRSIPYGETMSYGEQATVLGDPNKARAVGTANGRNPISIVVPCHRVIGANGSLTGFAGGMKAKKFLLDLEKKNAPARLPIRKANEDPRLAEMFSKGLTGPSGDPLNIFGVLGNHPDMLKRWLVFATHVLSKNTLTARDRELLILRTGWNCRSRYEWAQHVEIALRCDITAAEIKAVKKGASASNWSQFDKLLLTAADELHNEYALSDATWRNLGKHYSNEQILDLIATVGNYHLVAMFLNSTKVPIDAGIPDDPDLL
jgi:methylated-DNA-[protein]-cysteine S-methyltransferase